ncbi:MAG: radical SAM protein [Candidatus Aenigmatarchaeota archaeon]
MKIVFVDPKGVWEGLNNGIAYIVSNIGDQHEIKVVDFVNRSGNVKKRLDVAKDADFVGISMKSFTLDESIMVANMVRKINPAAKIIAGGPHVMVDGVNLLRENPIFDFGVFGEAETTFKEILSGKDPATIGGVIHRAAGEVIKNPSREWNTDLDSLPFPTYDNFDSLESKIENWPLVTSRGCPYLCGYCFSGDMLVRTDIGIVKIKDVENGMKVITDKGRWKHVVRTFKRHYSGKMLKINVNGKDPILATPNHKVKVFRNKFEMIRADELEAHDMVVEVLPTVSSAISGNQFLMFKNKSTENLLKINSIEEINFSDNVYNLEVEDDHTYTVNGIAVSNCNVPAVIGRRFRTRSGRNIFDELMYAKEKYGSKEFKILDDNFTLQMDRAKDICKLFIDEKLNMKWTCPNGIRADRLDEELCFLMKEAGCYSMSIGVESGDPEVFDKINKGEKLEDVERGIKLAQAAGIKVHGFFIIGLVGSTYESDKRSMEFAKRLGITASWGILVPYPGTEVWEQIKHDPKTRILRDWKEGFHVGARPKPVFDTLEYTAEERVRAYYYANMTSIKKKDIPRAAKMIIKGLISGK